MRSAESAERWRESRCTSGFSHQAIGQGNIASILVLHAGALGDFVLTLHVLARLRTRFPDARIETLVRSPLADWMAGRGIIDHAHAYEGSGVERLFGATRGAQDNPFFEALRDCDLVLNFLDGDDGDAAAGLRRLAAHPVISVDPAPRPETLGLGRHITEQWMDDMTSAGLDLHEIAPARARLDRAARDTARSGLQARCGVGNGPLAIVHPGSGGRAKCAPLEFFEQAVHALRAAGYGVCWMVGPTEHAWYGPAWVDRLRGSAPVLYEEEVGRAADWLFGADRYVGNDAGMTHLAAALGVETMVLFGPTDPRVWRPLGEKVSAVGCGAEFKRLPGTELVAGRC